MDIAGFCECCGEEVNTRVINTLTSDEGFVYHLCQHCLENCSYYSDGYALHCEEDLRDTKRFHQLLNGD